MLNQFGLDSKSNQAIRCSTQLKFQRCKLLLYILMKIPMCYMFPDLNTLIIEFCSLHTLPHTLIYITMFTCVVVEWVWTCNVRDIQNELSTTSSIQTGSICRYQVTTPLSLYLWKGYYVIDLPTRFVCMCVWVCLCFCLFMYISLCVYLSIDLSVCLSLRLWRDGLS